MGTSSVASFSLPNGEWFWITCLEGEVTNLAIPQGARARIFPEADFDPDGSYGAFIAADFDEHGAKIFAVAAAEVRRPDSLEADQREC